jgi:hypothetical protein
MTRTRGGDGDRAPDAVAPATKRGIIHHPLLETPRLPSAQSFAEGQKSGTRQTSPLPSVKSTALGKQ